ncbi:restriction endonuclease subunit S [Nocardia wallacei]|uniref:restriction endonuclease subunit S n=1 Tax=Nocardia wallacei TaxID=480035 RepID=UPI00245460C8|nr:restriction endonuclease subunit S [Nocardia wallacei]
MKAVGGNERVVLRELAEITPGPSGSLFDGLGDTPDGVPVVTPSDITSGSQVDARTLRRLPDEPASRLDRFTLRQDDIVVVRQGALGRLAMVGPGLAGALYNSSCARVRSDNRRVLPQYLFAYLSSSAVQEEILQRALPGTIPSINATLLGDLPVIVPPLETQDQVVAVVADVDELTLVHRAAAERLEILKQALLDDLLRKG